MHAAIVNYKIRLFGIKTLKEKRSLMKHLINELRSKFNVSVSEVGLCDSTNWAEIGVAVVSSSQEVVENTIQNVTLLIENSDGIEVEEIDRESW
ncbi:DUF503 domain-containing protein [Pseudothermotoga thermarum]|uniref:DUF503 domain-containing protein n=1 Tax=Pseudothermotoga thermarum DSM 5069 TaxID=688269 RepID=F7YXM2_9THEM|nr:DUF503 domain-containing protein [Pseudothermotoga thermarum]AEH50664.1 protein of unknown function DUF503 [Pseudothermotoga thermarum DSM 5069]